MKIEQINNPHIRIGPELKKTKAQEKDELIAITKQNVIDKHNKKQLASKKGF